MNVFEVQTLADDLAREMLARGMRPASATVHIGSNADFVLFISWGTYPRDEYKAFRGDDLSAAFDEACGFVAEHRTRRAA